MAKGNKRAEGTTKCLAVVAHLFLSVTNCFEAVTNCLATVSKLLVTITNCLAAVTKLFVADRLFLSIES